MEILSGGDGSSHHHHHHSQHRAPDRGPGSPRNSEGEEVYCPICDEGPLSDLPSHLSTLHGSPVNCSGVGSSSSGGSVGSGQRLLLEDANLLLTVGMDSRPSSRASTIVSDAAIPVNLSLRGGVSGEGSSGSVANSSSSNRKRRKQTQVPEVNKDERYWARRLKNNEAAKRSRDMRIMRERVIFEENARLERLASELRSDLERVSMDNKELTLKMGLILEENSRLKALLGYFTNRQQPKNHNNNHILDCLQNCDTNLNKKNSTNTSSSISTSNAEEHSGGA